MSLPPEHSALVIPDMFNPSSAVWAKAIINMFARETGRDYDRINVLHICVNPKRFSYVAFLLIVLLVFKNRTLVGNKNSFLGRNLCGGIHKWWEVKAVSSVPITYNLHYL